MSKYYVYFHREPETGRIRYVGLGTGSRAWEVRYTSNYKTGYGQRSKEHYDWWKELESSGHTLADIVEIVSSNLSKESANLLETNLIKQYEGTGLLFNKSKTFEHNKTLTKYSEEVISFAKKLHLLGFGYQRIAFLLGATEPKKSVMSIKRMVKNEYYNF